MKHYTIKNWILFVAFMVFAMSGVRIQALPLRLYDESQLSSSLITSMCQDRLGYIWIGTEYGLNKFDGIHVQQYFSDESDKLSIADDIIRNLMTDSRGDVWVITNLSVQRYNAFTNGFDAVSINGESALNINDILETKDGHIWILNAQNGIYEVDRETMTARPLPEINKHLRKGCKIDNVFLDSRGRLWIGYTEKGLEMIDTKSGKTRFFEGELFSDNRATDITEDARHRIVMSTYTSILVYNETKQSFEQVVGFKRMLSLRLHVEGNKLMLNTSGNGLWEIDIDNRTCTIMNQPKNLDGEKVSAYLRDREGNMWIGWCQRGLIFSSASPSLFQYTPLTQVQSNNGNVLRYLYADSDKNIYVCQEKGGISVNNIEGQMVHHWMDGHTVLTICPDKDGQLLVGTYHGGLFRLNPKTGSEEQLVSNQRISSITLDKSGNIYTAVFSEGLHSYTPDGKTERILGKGKLKLTNPYLNVLFRDRQGRIWIGHYYGIDVYDPTTDRMANIHVDETLRPAIVYGIQQSPVDNSIWIASNKGLFQYTEKGEWKRLTTKDGLPNNIVCSIVMTPKGTVWVGTYRGLCRVDTDGKIIPYYRGNGLKESSFMRGVGAFSGLDEVVLGNLNGITHFNPDNITKETFNRGITLTGMRLGDMDVNASTLSNGSYILTKPIEESSDICVSYLDNTFSLRFSTLDFRDAENVHYEYRFKDEPKEVWHKTESGVSEIFLTHLSVGSHHLQVRAYDNGLYSAIKEINIIVTPPWYRTWGAYILYIVIISFIILQFWRSWWARRQAEINEEKIKFFVDISHELRSPLTLIKSPLDKMLHTVSEPSQVRALRNIERNTNRLLTLTNQILSIRKIEKGQLTLHFAETQLSDFVSGICHDYDYQLEKRKIEMSFTDEAPDMKVWIDKDNFDKIVTNLVGNAIKYVDDGGKIEVVVRQTTDGKAELVVRDNGQGIDEAQLKKIFERFYQTSARPVAGQMSYGIGLNLTQKLVTMHRGTITARNRTDGERGSEFIVHIPLGSKHLPQDQLVDNDYFAVQSAPETSPLITDREKSQRVRKKTTYHVAVVDDDEEIRNFLNTELGETYHIHLYSDGQKGLEGIVDTVPDLVISDVVMPEMDGFELLKRIKSSTKTSHIPVILLTTKIEHQARIKGLEQGADAYIEKPFNLEELETRIAGLLANRLRLKGKYSGLQEQEDTVRKVALQGNDARLMERIMKAVNERLDDSDFNVEALAEEVGLSRVQLHRRMKELTGITVGEFIRNLRLQQAARLLEAGDTTVAQVTYAVGFANPTHFSSAFKKHFGVTPSEYINKFKSKGE